MFILFAASFLYMYVKNIITKKYVILLVGTLVILDMWSINKRYLNKDSFVDEFTYNVVKDNEDLKIIENNKNEKEYMILLILHFPVSFLFSSLDWGL